MNGYFEYIALYESKAIADYKMTAICDPVCVEIFTNKREFSVSPTQDILLLGTGCTKAIVTPRKLSLREGHKYILLKVRTKENDITKSTKLLNDNCPDDLKLLISELKLFYQN